MGLIPVIPALGLDAWTFYLVFVEVARSTVSIALITTPIINLIIVVPVGMSIGWLAVKWMGGGSSNLSPQSDARQETGARR